MVDASPLKSTSRANGEDELVIKVTEDHKGQIEVTATVYDTLGYVLVQTLYSADTVDIRDHRAKEWSPVRITTPTHKHWWKRNR